MDPDKFINNGELSTIAKQFIVPKEQIIEPIQLTEQEAELNVFGRPLIKSNAYQQMKTAMKLPIVRKGALMPDSHLGYGLPIGAVLATENTICLLYTSPSPRDQRGSRMPSSA